MLEKLTLDFIRVKQIFPQFRMFSFFYNLNYNYTKYIKQKFVRMDFLNLNLVSVTNFTSSNFRTLTCES